MGVLGNLDSPQIVKMVYDPATSSYKVIPAVVGTTSLLSAPASTSTTSNAVNIGPFKVCGMVIFWSGLDKTDGTIQFMGSVDGDPNRYDPIGSAITLGSASGHHSVSLIDEPYQFIQIVYTHGTNTVGTVSANYFLRG